MKVLQRNRVKSQKFLDLNGWAFSQSSPVLKLTSHESNVRFREHMKTQAYPT